MKYSARLAIGISLVAIFGISSASAQVAGKPSDPAKEQTQPAKEQKKTEAKPAPTSGGAVVFIDPVTHQIRQPDPSEIGALTQPPANTVTSSQAAAPVMIYGPGAAVGVKLDDSTMSYMVVTKKDDGKLDMDCVTGDKAAADALSHPKATAVPAKPVIAVQKKEPLDVQ